MCHTYHVVITGDLTNIALEDEFSASLSWLQKLGGPQRVSLIPGNHGHLYARERIFSVGVLGRTICALMSQRIRGQTLSCYPQAFPPTEFPTLRLCGPLALVGVSTARATAPFYASGTIGRTQLGRLEQLLSALANTPLSSGRAYSPPSPLPRHRSAPPPSPRCG